jgi:hypothetical protein
LGSLKAYWTELWSFCSFSSCLSYKKVRYLYPHLTHLVWRLLGRIVTASLSLLLGFMNKPALERMHTERRGRIRVNSSATVKRRRFLPL